MSTGVSLFIVVFTLVNILACLWLMWWTSHGQKAASAAPRLAGEDVEKTGHVWDGDLEEYNNPLPRWWLWLFIITVIFGLAYLVIYPGLGSFAGTRGWSQVGQWERQTRHAQAAFEERLAPLAGLSLHELSQHGGAMSTARNLFAANCSTCHGSDARGARGFPNLTNGDWLWGGSAESIYQSVALGRHGVMPALGEALGVQGVNEVASYVISLNGRQAPADWVVAGKTRFDMLCVACHGADGKGNQLLGAPDLTNDIWLHGGDFDAVRATITRGRDSQMPAHAALLGESKVRLLAAYVLSLNEDGSRPAQAVVEDGEAAADLTAGLHQPGSGGPEDRRGGS